MINGHFPIAVLLVLIFLPLSAFLVWSTYRNPEPPRYYPLFVVFAFPMSIVWIYLISDQLLGLLESLGAAIGLNRAILAITILSWGNSMGDTISNVVVAKKGLSSMAVGACFGGP